jgi:hypothetical protein
MSNAPCFALGLVDMPRSTNLTREAGPLLFEFWNMSLDPAHERRMSERHPIRPSFPRDLRQPSLYRRRQRAWSTTIPRSKWRPLKRSSPLGIALIRPRARFPLAYMPRSSLFAPDPPKARLDRSMPLRLSSPMSTWLTENQGSASAWPPRAERCLQFETAPRKAAYQRKATA